MVLVLAAANRLADVLTARLARDGVPHARLGRDWVEAPLVWTVDPFGGRWELDGRWVELAELSGVFATPDVLPVPKLDATSASAAAIYVPVEQTAALVGLLDALPCPVANPFRPEGPPRGALRWAKAFEAAGLHAPEALVAGDVPTVVEWLGEHPGTVVAGRVAHAYEDRPLAPAEAEAVLAPYLANGAVLVRRVPRGRAITAFVVGDEVLLASPDDRGLLQPTAAASGITDAARGVAARVGRLLVRLELFDLQDGRIVAWDGTDLVDAPDASPAFAEDVAAHLARLLTGASAP